MATIGGAQAVSADNDNLPISAEFKLPELFVHVYQRELNDWAAKLQRRGPVEVIRLWNRPVASVLDVTFWPEVKVRCDVYADTVSKRLRMVIKPDTEQDEEIIRKHTEALPGIIEAQRAAALADKGKRKSMARWTFDLSLPEYFVLRYQSELREWAANFAKIGSVKHIVLSEGGLADLSPNPEQGAVLLQVALKAKIERKSGDDFEIVASAATEQDEALIRRHCEKLVRAGVPARAVLVEPPRPFVPFVPSKWN